MLRICPPPPDSLPMADEESAPAPGSELVPGGHLRASHDDRDRAVEMLRVAAGDGRLTLEELNERVGAALTARIHGELAALVSDLPAASASPAVKPKDLAHLRALLLVYLPGRPVRGTAARQPQPLGRLTGITAAVVGVIANLALYFAVHTLLATSHPWRWGPLRLELPELSSLRPVALAITVAALVLVFRLRWSVPRTLAVCAGLGLAGALIGLPVS
jgi:Domain of unknown function (DUF1707)